jgi:signal transduction histidine kinase
MFLPERELLRNLVRHLPAGLAAGMLFGGFASGWVPAYVFKGALIGIVFLIPAEIGTQCFRSWTLPARAAGDTRGAGFLFAPKLLVIWAAGLAVTLPVIHWVIGIPVLSHFNSILPFASCSLAWVTVMLVADTATRLFRTGSELARAQARAEFLALEAQLQPHTLFNALNGIVGLIREHPREAEEATRRLASLMRHVLAGLDQAHWTLADEFGVVEDLVRLETLRFGDRLKTEILLDASMASRQVPPLSILPLVENSLRHGFRTKVGSCSLRVEAADGSVSVKDDGAGFDPAWREGVGLRTVRERIEAEGGKPLFPSGSSGTCVKLCLP